LGFRRRRRLLLWRSSTKKQEKEEKEEDDWTKKFSSLCDIKKETALIHITDIINARK